MDRDAIQLYGLLGSGVVLIGGLFTIGAPKMLSLWIRSAGPALGAALMAISVGLLATKLGVLTEYRGVVLGLAWAALLVQAVTLWGVTIAWLIVRDLLDPNVRASFLGTAALTMAAIALFMLCSIYGGLWAQ